MNMEEAGQQVCDTSILSQFKSFIVLDFETNNLPNHNFNKVSMTEISMYGCLKEHFMQSAENAKNRNDTNDVRIPKIPRVTQKLILSVSPNAPIHPSAEEVTCLNNYLLEKCATFNEHTANIILNFIKQLPQPVCLVAHNGFQFDFPILKSLLDKFKVELPADTLCIDSLHAFYEIDGIGITTEAIEICEKLQQEKDWQILNENTPKRARISPENKPPMKPAWNGAASSQRITFNSRKNLFPDPDQKPETSFQNTAALKRMKNFYLKTPKGFYKLGDIYERHFGARPDVAHFAEADVHTLLLLMLHYGKEFLTYTENWAVPFHKIPCKFIITN